MLRISINFLDIEDGKKRKHIDETKSWVQTYVA